VTYVLALTLLLLWAPTAAAQDADRDGLDDSFEQVLLERFTPVFYVSAGECDGLPASFVRGTKDPVVAARNGTIHGRAFPASEGAIELQYFHLWARDCGRGGHDLDAEHVSALIEPQSDGTWAARLWYAAAHEDTICDQSSGARASTVGAVTGGAPVYISRGKHASYLERGHCTRGCGGDVCPLGQPMEVSALLNIGEPGAPLNGATWMASARWPLGLKLRSDFAPHVRSRLDRSETGRVISLTSHLRAPQAPVLAGDTALDGLAHAGRSSVTSLDTTRRAVGTALEQVGAGVARLVASARRIRR
jgi:hypothetical protein